MFPSLNCTVPDAELGSTVADSVTGVPVSADWGACSVSDVTTSASATWTDCTAESDPLANAVASNRACTDRVPAVVGVHEDVAAPDAFSRPVPIFVEPS